VHVPSLPLSLSLRAGTLLERVHQGDIAENCRNHFFIIICKRLMPVSWQDKDEPILCRNFGLRLDSTPVV
jgi:hypothetical protein